jgi:exoribonuclease R
MTSKRAGESDVISRIKRTLPIGIELHRSYNYAVPLGGKQRLALIVLKLYCPDELEFKLDQWRSEMANQLDMVTLLVKRVKSEQNIQSNLRNEFKGSALLTATALPILDGMIESLCGSPPEAVPQTVPADSRREDLTEIPFIAIDRSETRDIEDLIHAERKSNGALVWRTAYISATDYVTPGSAIDRYALRVAQTIYGRHRAISTLGAGLSHDAVSFLPGQIRPAWIIEGTLTPKPTEPDQHYPQNFPEYELRYKVRFGLVRNHLSIDPTLPLNPEKSPSISRSLTALAEVARILQRRRSLRSSLLRVDGDGAIELILAEIMIESKRLLSEYLGEKQGYPMIYRVHQKPSAEVVSHFHQALNALGIPNSISDFEHPSQFAGILQSLETRHDQASQAVLNNLLDTFLLRSLYSTENSGHYGLRVEQYAEFKPRDASGIANQYQLAAIFENRPALSKQELKERANLLNDKRWRRDERGFKLIFLEMLYEKLASVGAVCIGAVAELKRGKIYVDMQGFSKWGLLESNEEALKLEVGDPIAAELKGFDLESMRFLFSITTEALSGDPL